jgi:hypothetical protein
MYSKNINVEKKIQETNKMKYVNLGGHRWPPTCYTLSDGVSSAPNKDCMQKLHPREVDVSTTPIGAHKPFGVSSLGLGFWMFRVLSFMLYVKKAFGASL